MKDSVASSTAQDRDTSFRIAHISDIHFGINFDVPLWDYVQQLLRNDPPDLILITGDVVDSPSIINLLLARRQIEWLAASVTKSKSSTAYRIVPGNHDVAIMGNIKIWPSTRYFHWIFEGLSSREIEHLPGYVEFTESCTLRRLKFEWRIYKCFTQWLSRSARAWACRLVRPVARSDDPPEVFIAYLDSNSGLRLATGRVAESQVAALKGAVMNLTRCEDGETRAFVPRVALLHHHAMPIPYSDGNEGLTSFEPFLVLRNSGTLLRELCRQDFDLVLHGHKHYSNYCRVSFARPDDPDGEVSIIAAGSCGVGLPEEGRNSINLIDFSRNGQITVERCMFGNGESPDTSNRSASLRRSQLFDISGLKLRAYRRAVELQRREADVWYREVKIDASGSSSGKIYFDNFRLLGKSTVKHREIRLQTDIGILMPEAIEPDDASVKAGLHFQAFHPQAVDSVNTSQNGAEGVRVPEDDRVVVSRFDLEHAMTSTAEGIHYGIRYSSHNSFRISAWEARLMAGDARQSGTGQFARATENISLAVKFPCRKLVMKLHLPANLASPNTRVKVRRPSGYPFLSLSDGDVGPFHAGAENDSDMTSYESRNLRDLGGGVWCLEVDYPMVGYQYRIQWDIINREERKANPLDIGRAEAIRSHLLHGIESSRLQEIVSLAEQCKSQIKRLFGSKHCPEETVAVCLHVLDTSRRELRLITATSGADQLRSYCVNVPWAQGVLGTAAKKRRPVFFVAPRLRNGHYGGTRLHSTSGRSVESFPKDYSVLIAYPIMLQRKNQDVSVPLPPQELIGILSFGSDAPDSGLLRLLTRGTADGSGGLTAINGESTLRTMASFMESVLCLGDLDALTAKI